LIGGVGASSIFLRALVVLIVFAIFAALINFVSVTFLDSGSVTVQPQEKSQSSRSEGSNIDIVLPEDDSALAELGSEPGEFSGDELVSETEEVSSSESQKSSSSGNNPNVMSSMDIDTLPDLGSFSTTFTSAEDNEEKKTDSEAESGYNENTSFSSGKKLSADGLAGTIAEQNSPEDLAKAVKTVLNREETG